MKTQKILTEEIRDLTVASLPTRPTSPISHGGGGYSPTEMKQAFDKLPLYLVDHFNSLIDDLRGDDGGSVTDTIQSEIFPGHTLRDMLRDVKSGEFASYLNILGKPLSVHSAEILERLTLLEEARR